MKVRVMGKASTLGHHLVEGFRRIRLDRTLFTATPKTYTIT